MTDLAAQALQRDRAGVNDLNISPQRRLLARFSRRGRKPVNIVGGYKFPGAPVINLAPIPQLSRPVKETVLK